MDLGAGSLTRLPRSPRRRPTTCAQRPPHTRSYASKFSLDPGDVGKESCEPSWYGFQPAMILPGASTIENGQYVIRMNANTSDATSNLLDTLNAQLEAEAGGDNDTCYCG